MSRHSARSTRHAQPSEGQSKSPNGNTARPSGRRASLADAARNMLPPLTSSSTAAEREHRADDEERLVYLDAARDVVPGMILRHLVLQDIDSAGVLDVVDRLVQRCAPATYRSGMDEIAKLDTGAANDAYGEILSLVAAHVDAAFALGLTVGGTLNVDR